MSLFPFFRAKWNIYLIKVRAAGAARTGLLRCISVLLSSSPCRCALRSDMIPPFFVAVVPPRSFFPRKFFLFVFLSKQVYRLRSRRRRLFFCAPSVRRFLPGSRRLTWISPPIAVCSLSHRLLILLLPLALARAPLSLTLDKLLLKFQSRPSRGVSVHRICSLACLQ